MSRSRITVLLVVALLAGCGPSAARVPTEVLERLDGSPTSFEVHSGTPLVVNFFASWCGPCVDEMPELEALHRSRSDVRVLGVNTQDAPLRGLELVESTGVTYEVIVDAAGRLYRDFGVVAMPSTFFVDGDGRIVHRHVGVATRSTLDRLVDEHLDP